MRIEFAILWSNMKLVFLPTTVTYPFQLALTNVIHGLDRMIPQSAPGRQLVLKHHCMLLPCNAACVQACILYAQRHKLTHKHITSSSPSIMAMCIHVFLWTHKYAARASADMMAVTVTTSTSRSATIIPHTSDMAACLSASCSLHWISRSVVTHVAAQNHHDQVRLSSTMLTVNTDE